MPDSKDYKIAKALADDLITGPDDPLEHRKVQMAVMIICGFIFRTLPGLRPLILRMIDPDTKYLLEDKTNMELPQHVRVQRFWKKLATGTTALTPIIIE